MKLTISPPKALLAAALTAVVGAAQADQLSVLNTYVSSAGVPFVAQYLDDDVTPSISGVMGLWNVQNQTAGTSFLAYCLEPLEAAVQPFQTYTASAYANASVQELYDRFYGSVTADPASSVRAMGFQLALWQLHGGYATSAWDLPSADIVAEANNMLSVVNEAGTVAQQYQLTAWSSNGYQDVLQAAPVPEPQAYALMAAGLALVASIARRRAKSRS